MQEFVLPNLGDGIAAGDVLKVLVKAGDTLKMDQSVLELETDKATLEVPTTIAGVVKEVHVKAGDKVTPGQTILSIEEASGGADKPPEKADQKAAKQPDEKSATASAAAGAESAASGGESAPKTPAGGEGGPEAPEPAAPAAPEAREGPDRRASVVEFQARQQPGAPAAAAGPAAPAAPSVRRLAREIGVDVNQVPGSGAGGRISQDDVKAFARQVMSSLGGGGQAALAGGAVPARRAGAALPLPDFTKWGDVERKPMSGIRRKTADHLTNAWTTIPHVTQFDKADITNLEAMRKQFAPEVEKAGGKLTVTSIAAKILGGALKVFPQFNASVDLAAEAVVYKKYINVGIAVDTEHGLIVPVLRDVDTKNIVQLSVEIQQLAEKARARKLTLDEMSGGSMSISNLGGIGGTAFTPIVNWPEVAILGVSRGGFEPVWKNGAFEPRQMLPLSLSYDHRLIDGADAIRFLRWVVEALEQPFTLTLRG